MKEDQKSDSPRQLGDFAGFLRQLEEYGFEFAVIGGQAVAAYAQLLGEEVLSVDLDIYLTQKTLEELLAWAPRHGIRVIKRPQPRNIPVAFLEFDGMEINALTSSHGLRDPEVVVQTARNFSLSVHADLEVPIADPFDLLGNKLAVKRDKDLSHIEILHRFVEDEAEMAFHEEIRPRARLAPARRLLGTLGAKVLPAPLADRLIDLARTPVDYRFLMGRVPTREQAVRILEHTKESEEELTRELASILETRRFKADE